MLAKVRYEMAAEVKKFCSDRESAFARHPDLLIFIRLVFRTREERKNLIANILLKLRKIFDEGRKVTLQPHVVGWRHLQEWVPPLSKDLKSNSLLLQAMPCVVMETVRLQKELCEAWKEIEN